MSVESVNVTVEWQMEWTCLLQVAPIQLLIQLRMYLLQVSCLQPSRECVSYLLSNKIYLCLDHAYSFNNLRGDMTAHRFPINWNLICNETLQFHLRYFMYPQSMWSLEQRMTNVITKVREFIAPSALAFNVLDVFRLKCRFFVGGNHWQYFSYR